MCVGESVCGIESVGERECVCGRELWGERESVSGRESVWGRE